MPVPPRTQLSVIGSVLAFAGALFSVALAATAEWLACGTADQSCSRWSLPHVQLAFAAAGVVPMAVLLWCSVTMRGQARKWLAIGLGVYVVWGVMFLTIWAR